MLVILLGAVALILMNRGDSPDTGGDEIDSSVPEANTPVAGKGDRGQEGEAARAVGSERRFVPPVFPDELADVPATAIQEARDFIAEFRRQETPEERSDVLAEVRSLELEDFSLVNNLLIEEVVHGDEQVREAAYTALREYGGERAAEALENYLVFDRGAAGRTELEELVEFMRLPSASLVPGRSAGDQG